MAEMMSIEQTLAERGARYGDFAEQAEISQRLKEVVRSKPGWNRMNDGQREALDMILHKVARIVAGDPNYADNYHDIQGYARLVEERLCA